MPFFPALRTQALRGARRTASPATAPRTATESKLILSDYYTALLNAGVGLNDTAKPWPVERAVAEGYERVVWTFRAVSTIAENGARGDVPFEVVTGDTETPDVVEDHPVSRLLNGQANEMETGAVFRERLISQLLLSKRGVFVETTRSKGGTPMRYDLLPPGRTRIVPGQDTMIDHYEVTRRDGTTYTIDADRVRWIRHPHPLDPYSGVTPLESAGMSVELDYFARLYNVSFLRNDGRPGGVLAVEGDLDEDDLDRIESRFRSGPAEAGKLSVLAGKLSYADLAARPRDMAYGQASNNAKNEILCAFGTPETVLGNSSERCLRASELVRLADGRRVPAGQLVGTTFALMTSTPQGHVPVEAGATLENVSDIYRITTESGRTLETNGKHPLYAAAYLTTKEARWRASNGPKIDVKGWTPVAELATPPEIGRWVVAVPTVVAPAAHHNDLTTDEAFVLGALVGDGTITGGRQPVALTTPEGDFPKAFIRAIEALGDQVTRYNTGNRVAAWGVRADPANRPGSGRGARNACRTRVLLRRVGLYGTTSRTKFIPEEVFGATDEALAAFLGGLYAADGCIVLGKPSKSTSRGTTTIVLGTSSERLARDTQEALLRFGVNARLRHQTGKTGGIAIMAGKTYDTWEVAVSRSECIARFAAAIEIPGKQKQLLEAVARAEAAMEPKVHGGNVHTWRRKHLNPGLGWEQVTSVVKLPDPEPTVGIAVPGHHTYLSVLWEHNTYANAEADGYQFWANRMLNTLSRVAAGFTADLTEGERGRFNTSRIGVLELPERQRREEARSEFEAGLRSVKSYADLAGYGDEIADTPYARALWIPSGRTPMPARPEDAAALGAGEPVPAPGPGTASPTEAAPGVPAGETGATTTGDAGAPLQVPSQRVTPAAELPPGAPADAPTNEPTPAAANEPETKASPVADNWTGVSPADTEELAAAALTAALNAEIDRWAARAAARLRSPRARKGTRHFTPGHATDTRTGTKALDAAGAVGAESFADGVDSATRPVVEKAAMIAAAAWLTAATGQTTDPADLPDDVARAARAGAAAAMPHLVAGAEAQARRAAQAVIDTDTAGGTLDDAAQALAERGEIARRWSANAAEDTASAATEAGYVAAARHHADTPGVQVQQQWISKKDPKVRDSHRVAHGQMRDAEKPFNVGAAILRYPCDPLGPPEETKGCRCTTLWRQRRTGQFSPPPARETP